MGKIYITYVSKKYRNENDLLIDQCVFVCAWGACSCVIGGVCWFRKGGGCSLFSANIMGNEEEYRGEEEGHIEAYIEQVGDSEGGVRQTQVLILGRVRYLCYKGGGGMVLNHIFNREGGHRWVIGSRAKVVPRTGLVNSIHNKFLKLREWTIPRTVSELHAEWGALLPRNRL